MLLHIYSVCVLSHVQLFETPWIVAHQAPLTTGFSKARMLEWVAISSSRESSWPRDQTHVSCIGGWILYHWATWEAHTSITMAKYLEHWQQQMLSRMWSKMSSHSLLMGMQNSMATLEDNLVVSNKSKHSLSRFISKKPTYCLKKDWG